MQMIKNLQTLSFQGRLGLKICMCIFALVFIFSGFNGCSKDNQKKELVVCSYGGSFQDAQRKAFFTPFEKETGIKIVEANWSGEYAKLKAMVDSDSVTWDLVTVAEGSIIERGIIDNILEEINYSKIDKSLFFEGSLTRYSVGFDLFSTVMAYRTDAFQGFPPPQSWADFWNVEKYPGDRCLRKDPRTTLEFALLADGVQMGSLYPLDLDRAFKSLDKIKKHVKVWWSSGHQPAQLLASKEVVMVSAFNGRIWNAVKNDNVPAEVVWNQGALDVDSWVIPKGTKNFEAAMKLIEFTSRPEVQKEFIKYISYGPTIKSTFDNLDAKTMKDLPTAPENYPKQFIFNGKWWAENERMVEEKWNQWLIKD